MSPKWGVWRMCDTPPSPPPKWDWGDVPAQKVGEGGGVPRKWDLGDVSLKRGTGRRCAPSPNRGWIGDMTLPPKPD